VLTFTGKDTASIFWDSEDTVLAKLLRERERERGATINAQWHVQTLKKNNKPEGFGQRGR